jgi:hypothetical protein
MHVSREGAREGALFLSLITYEAEATEVFQGEAEEDSDWETLSKGSMATMTRSVAGPTASPVRRLPEYDDIQPTSPGNTEPPNPLTASTNRESELCRARSKKAARATGKIGASAKPSSKIAAASMESELETTRRVAALKAKIKAVCSKRPGRTRSMTSGDRARERRKPLQ